MSELLDLLNTAADRVSQETTDFNSESARGIVDASGGALSGFSTESGEDESGAMYARTAFQRAQRNMNLAESMNPEAEAAAIRASQKTGAPVSSTREWDNQVLNKPDLGTLSQETLEFLGEDLSNAVVTKDDVEAIDALVQTAKYARMSIEQRRKAMQEQVKAEGYSASQIADLMARGYTPANDPTGKDGVFTMDMGGIQATVKWPQLEEWYTNPEEQKFLEAQHKGAEAKLKKAQAETVEGAVEARKQERVESGYAENDFDLRGSAWLVTASPEAQTGYIQQLDKEIAAMRALYARYDDAWKSFSNEEMLGALDTISKETGLDVTDISLARLLPAEPGLTTTDWRTLGNFFGMYDFWDHRTGLTPKELDQIHRNPLAFDSADRLDVIDDLEQQAKALRGNSVANTLVEGGLNSLRFGAELGATGLGEAYELATKGMWDAGFRQGVKKVPKALWDIAKAVAKRLPTRSAQSANRALDAIEGKISASIQDGQVVPEYDEGEIGDFAKEFLNATLDQYIEDVSEGVGELVPFQLLGRAVPKTIQKRAFVQAAGKVLKKFGEREGVKQTLDVLKKMGWHNLPAEWFEEIAGDVARYAATGAANLAGTGYGDLGQDSVFQGIDGESLRLLEIATTGGLMTASAGTVALAGNTLRRFAGARNAVQFKAAVSTLKERVDAASTTNKRSPEIMEYLLRKSMGFRGFAYLTPEMAGAYFQSMPDTMRAAGVDEDTIGKATTEERLVPVSVPALLARGSAEEVNQVLDDLIPDPRNMLTPADADKILPGEMDEATKKASEELEDKKAAIQEFMEQLKAAGRPMNEIRAAAKLLNVAEYFAAHNTEGMTAAEWIRKLKVVQESEADFMARFVEKENSSLYQGVIGIPGFYSNMMQALEDAPQQKMTPAQWMAYLQKSGGLKAGETSWRGSVEKFFEGRDPNTAVDKQEIVDAFQDGMVDILEMGTGIDETYELNNYLEQRYDDSHVHEAQQKFRELLGETDDRYYMFAARAMTRLRNEVLRPYIYDDMMAEKGPDVIKAEIEAMYGYMTEDKLKEYIDLYRNLSQAHVRQFKKEPNSDEEARQAEERIAEFEKEARLFGENAAADIPRRPVKKVITPSSVRDEYTTKGLDYHQELVIYAPEVASFQESDPIHFGRDTNGTALVWVRFGATTDAAGNRVLVIDEIQSNRHQEGREHGYTPIPRKGALIQAKKVYLVNVTGRASSFVLPSMIEDVETDESQDTSPLFSLRVTPTQGRIVDLLVDPDGVISPGTPNFAGKKLSEVIGEDVAEEVMNTLIRPEAIGKQVLFGDENGVPAAPFEKNWYELGMKRMIRYAAAHGFDKIAWTSGEQQAKRYNIGNVITSIDLGRQSEREKEDGEQKFWLTLSDGYREYVTVRKDGEIIRASFAFAEMQGKDIHEVFGKELGNRMMGLMEGAETGTESEERQMYGVSFAYWNGNGNAELNVYWGEDAEGDVTALEVDLDGKIIEGYAADTVFDAFGDEVGQEIVDHINTSNEGAWLQVDKSVLVGGKTTSIRLDDSVVIGGEGMKTFYDKILKNFTDKYIKKWGAKVGVVELPEVEETGREMWGFDVTPAMKAAVMGHGQPLFQSNIPRRERPDYIGLTPTEQAEVDRQRAEVRAKYEGTDQWMKAPNGKPSNLSEDLWITVRTEAFKRWFGDWENVGSPDGRSSAEDSSPVTSALNTPNAEFAPVSNNTPTSRKSQAGVLDKNGEPLLVYHGTLATFQSFWRGDLGIHFGTEEQADNRARSKALESGDPNALDYAGIYAGFLRLKNPLYIPHDYGDWNASSIALWLLAEDNHGRAPLTLSERDKEFLKKVAFGSWSEKRSNREVRHWLRNKGFDGIEYANGVEGSGSSYLIFNSRQFKEAENLGTFDYSNPYFYFQSSVTPDVDDAFIEAEKQGNYNEAQRLVDEAAGYDPKKATYPGEVAKVYHYGVLGNDVFVADRPVHLGTEQAARERIPGKMKEDFLNSVEVYQDEDGRWTWAEPNGMESGQYFSSEEAVRQWLSNSDFWLEGEELEGEAEKIHSYFVSTENFKTVPDMIDQNGWDEAIAKAKEEGYRGIRYRNVVEDHGSWSYIVFNSEDMKLADPFTYDDDGNLIPLSERFNDLNQDVRYQSKKGEPHRGALTSLNDDWEATMALFDSADGSTVVHETAHFIFDMMEKFVENGLADERMQSDYKKLVDWMTLTPEQAAKGYEAYLKTVPEGTEPMTPEQWKYIEEQERLARGFEAYCMEGRAPSVELQGAFATLRRILLHIYKTVRALGVQLTDDVRQVFDGMLATETTLLRDSILLEAAEQIDRELLGLSQAEVKTFRELIQKSNEQAVAEMTAEKNRQLTELRKQWRAEAKELMADDPVYSVWYAVQKEGKMDYLAVQEIVGDYIAQRLRAMGLVTAPGRRRKDGSYPNAKAGKHPATMAAQAGFDSVEEMIDQLLVSKSPKDFTAEYMADEERKFNAEFAMSEKAQSVQASIEALEKLSEMLAVKGGQIGYRFRRALLKQQALAELNSMSVAHIVSDKKLIADCRMNARNLTKAANEGDFKGAFEHAKALRFNLEVLRMKGDAKKVVDDTIGLLRKGRHAKKGTIYGDHQDALMDLSFRFGFTNKLPAIQHSVASVVAEFNEEAAANGDLPLDVPDWMLNFSMDYRKMTFGQFQELKNLADFLYGEGKELVSAREETFRNSVKQAVEGTVAELQNQKHKYTRSTNFIVKGWRGMVNWGTKLRNIVGMAVNWNPDATLQKLYDEMAYAESEQTQIMADPMRQATAALDALYKATRGLNLESISDIPFPQDVKAEGYRKWDAEKVVAACLNMGTLKNRQRLIDGYEWGENGEEYVERIASLLTAEDWANIQAIWNAISSLTPRTAQTFKEEYHYDLKLEEAAPFTVKTKDGQEIAVLGGYYPLEYLYHTNTVVNDKVDALKNAPKFRRASFTFERNEKVTDPLALSLNTVFNHIFDASHYISHRHVMRKVLRVINDRAFRSHFQQTQGFERYAALKALVENVAAPGAALKGMTSEFENWGRAVVTASALWASPSVVAMQLSSITYGLDELGGYYLEAAAENMAHPVDTFKFVMEHSGMMRDRVNLKDLDLKTRANEFRQNQAQRIREMVKQFGYSPMRFVDLAVAIPAWKGAYDKALDEGKSDSQAVAAADEFVAKTQGATRAIDLSPLQLKPWGRGLTVFFSAVSAGSTMATKTVSRIFGGDITVGEAAYSATMNLVLPLLFSCLIRYAVSGAGAGDDPDKARRAFLRELMTNPFQGIPLLRDVADFAAGRTLNPSHKTQRTVFENTSLRGASDLVVTAFDGVQAAFEENPDRAVYKLADAVGTLFQVPVVRVYERARQMLVDWTGDEDILPDIDEETKQKKSNKKRRR